MSPLKGCTYSGSINALLEPAYLQPRAGPPSCSRQFSRPPGRLALIILAMDLHLPVGVDALIGSQTPSRDLMSNLAYRCISTCCESIGATYDLGAIADLQLFHDSADTEFHGALADPELMRYDLVSFA
jgi:hypothetical protein